MRKRIVLNGRNEYDGSPSHYCFDFDVKFNRHGNIEVIVDKTSSSFVSFFRAGKYVFTRSGFCISHPASERYRYHKVNAELVESHT